MTDFTEINVRHASDNMCSHTCSFSALFSAAAQTLEVGSLLYFGGKVLPVPLLAALVRGVEGEAEVE